MGRRGIAFRLTNKTDFFTLHSVDGHDKYAKLASRLQKLYLVFKDGIWAYKLASCIAI